MEWIEDGGYVGDGRLQIIDESMILIDDEQYINIDES